MFKKVQVENLFVYVDEANKRAAIPLPISCDALRWDGPMLKAVRKALGRGSGKKSLTDPWLSERLGALCFGLPGKSLDGWREEVAKQESAGRVTPLEESCTDS